MMGCYDFCGHYEWTFEWLRRQGGERLVRAYWNEAIAQDSQRHARDLIVLKGFAGMAEYWAHALAEEAAGFVATRGDEVFRLDISDCPSKGFLLRNRLKQYHDYCDHCIGWIEPVMAEAGFQVHHEHNHCGKCWWEFRRQADDSAPSEPAALAGAEDVRTQVDWLGERESIDVFRAARDAAKKKTISHE